MADIKRRAFKEKFVNNVKLDDYNVALTGTVAGKKDNGFLLADGTGEIYINTSEVEGIVSEGMFVRILGRIMPYEEGFELQAEIIQDMKGLNKEAHNKIKERLS